MFGFSQKKKTIHLDYASTTPVYPDVLKAMLPYFSTEWANASALYGTGVRTRGVIEDVREKVARMLRIRAHGVVFTSGGTESNNQAIVGVVEALHKAGRSYDEMEIVTTEIEHASILEVCAMYSERGVRIVYVPLQEDGLIVREEFENVLSPRTVLVTFAYVNSEIGVVQDVKRITRTVRGYNDAHGTNILVHLDAAQAPLWLPCEMDMLGVDLLSLDSGKCYGPKGAGVLAFRHGVTLSPLMFGGGQEGGVRSGTENTPLVVGCGMSLLRAQEGWKSRAEAASTLRDFFFDLIEKEIPEAVVNGSRSARVSNNANISIPGIDSEFAVITLDHHGVNASTKSACGAYGATGSSVIRTLTRDESRATSTLRFTLGEETTKKDIETAVQVLKEHVQQTRQFQSLGKE
jgi:cysteine desulfurase